MLTLTSITLADQLASACTWGRPVMLNNYSKKATVTTDRKIVEEVKICIYLGSTVTRDGDLTPEIKRYIALGWATFGKVDNIMRS